MDIGATRGAAMISKVPAIEDGRGGPIGGTDRPDTNMESKLSGGEGCELVGETGRRTCRRQHVERSTGDWRRD
jgi:hypothetical protein